MASYNKVILMGNIAHDPQLKTLTSGTSATTICLAINRKYKKTDGSQGEEVTFVYIDAFGKSAETLAKYCQKGSGLHVEARLKNVSFKDKNGENKQRLTLILESFQFIGGAGNKQREAYND